MYLPAKTSVIQHTRVMYILTQNDVTGREIDMHAPIYSDVTGHEVDACEHHSRVVSQNMK